MVRRRKIDLSKNRRWVVARSARPRGGRVDYRHRLQVAYALCLGLKGRYRRKAVRNALNTVAAYNKTFGHIVDKLHGPVRESDRIGPMFNGLPDISGIQYLGPRLIQGSEKQRGERQHADPTGTAVAPDVSKRRINPEAPGFRRFSANECESAARHIEQGRRRGLFASECLEHHAGAVGQIDRGAVDQTNADSATGRSLDNVTFENRIAKFDLNRGAVRPREAARANERPDFANKACGSPHGL